MPPFRRDGAVVPAVRRGQSVAVSRFYCRGSSSEPAPGTGCAGDNALRLGEGTKHQPGGQRALRTPITAPSRGALLPASCARRIGSPGPPGEDGADTMRTVTQDDALRCCTAQAVYAENVIFCMAVGQIENGLDPREVFLNSPVIRLRVVVIFRN